MRIGYSFWGFLCPGITDTPDGGRSHRRVLVDGLVSRGHDPELRGLDHGDADGRPWHAMKTAFGGPPHHDPDQPYATGAEPWNHYLQRVGRALQAIIDRHDGHRILIAGHGETIEAAHTLLLDLSAQTRRGSGFITDHACLAWWQLHVNRFGRTVWMLAAHNDTAHLAAIPR